MTSADIFFSLSPVQWADWETGLLLRPPKKREGVMQVKSIFVLSRGEKAPKKFLVVFLIAGLRFSAVSGMEPFNPPLFSVLLPSLYSPLRPCVVFASDQSQSCTSFVGRFFPVKFAIFSLLSVYWIGKSPSRIGRALALGQSKQLKLSRSRKTAKGFLSCAVIKRRKRRPSRAKLNSVFFFRKIKQKEGKKTLIVYPLPLDAITFRCDFPFSVSFFPLILPTATIANTLKGTVSDLGWLQKQGGQWLSRDLWLDILFFFSSSSLKNTCCTRARGAQRSTRHGFHWWLVSILYTRLN